MNQKFSLLFTTLFISISAFSQQIYIGQNANEIKQLIEYSVQSNNRADSYGNRSTTRKEWDVKYQNGRISDVILCYYNEYLIDIGVTADFCKHFLMTNNKLSSILTQYETLSVSQLKSFYNKLNGKTKVGEFYLDDDYKNYSKIYLHNNGLATVEWTKTDVNTLPKNIRSQIESKLNKQKEEENNRILARQKERQRKKEITSKIYDLKADFPEDYENFIRVQRNKIIQYFRDCAKGRYSSGFIPKTYEIEDNKEKFAFFESTYNVEYFDNNSGYTERNVKLVSGTDDKLSLIKLANQRLPKLEIEGYRVKKKLNISELKVNYVLGFTKIKVKDGEIEFKSNPPMDRFKNEITENLKSEKNGKYYIIYEVADVLDSTTVRTKIIDKNNRYDIMKELDFRK